MKSLLQTTDFHCSCVYRQHNPGQLYSMYSGKRGAPCWIERSSGNAQLNINPIRTFRVNHNTLLSLCEKCFVRLRALPLIPYGASLSNNLWWLTLSNAFLKSIIITSPPFTIHIHTYMISRKPILHKNVVSQIQNALCAKNWKSVI